jgi:hypothetical protein
VQLLELGHTDWEFLGTGLHGPQLKVLRRGTEVYCCTSDLALELEEPDDAEQQLALVERCAKGALRYCNHLSLYSCQPEPETVAAVLQALGRWWRPDPSLVDGSHPLMVD